jgi:hypothetical protein
VKVAIPPKFVVGAVYVAAMFMNIMDDRLGSST